MFSVQTPNSSRTFIRYSHSLTFHDWIYPAVDSCRFRDRYKTPSPLDVVKSDPLLCGELFHGLPHPVVGHAVIENNHVVHEQQPTRFKLAPHEVQVEGGAFHRVVSVDEGDI
eukprot:CAMPEP_0171827400 /NCGR_PEP_ID=MMETSP0992-20121227/6617_1 /TAXON_ID=483369 /ORGANISM="non described non described, Strain CCMP2098" /LENGTH=111 /DNA_ID=CAMNT_0012442529 /DNA_START=89 /DNA_END=424 /DNA_ORIENTATION=-